MTPNQAILRLMNECDIYFEDSLISKELIIQTYAEFFASSFEETTHKLSIVQHTGSVCFDVISILISALGCLMFNETDNEDVICSLENGQVVLLSDKKGKERCLWRGFVKTANGSDFEAAGFDDAEYVVLEQPSSSTKRYIPKNLWNCVSPYNGASTRTDGRGIKRTKSNRNEFVSYLFKVPIASIPSVIGVSTVIVIDWEIFKRVVDGIRVEYGEGESISLLDLVTISYYTSNLEEQRYGANPAKNEPNLKVTSRISAARDLVLDKSGNKTVGFMVLGTDNIVRGNSELVELLERRSLKFSVLTANMDSTVAKELIEMQDEASIFVCTREFLLHYSTLPKVKNRITVELNCQIENIINYDVTPVTVEGVCNWQENKALKNALFTIKGSNINREEKDDFIVTAYALMNLILTAIFPLVRLNTALERNELVTRATAPSAKLNEIWMLADKSSELIEQFLIIADLLDRLYHSILTTCPKYETLKYLVEKYSGRKIAVIVPKAYYVDILKSDDLINKKCSEIITVNRFNRSERYDIIFVVGDILGTKFNPFTCRAASDIFVLLYDGEKQSFIHKKQSFEAYEKNINIRQGVKFDEEKEDDPSDNFEIADAETFVTYDSDLKQYVESMTSFDVLSFAQKLCGNSDNIPPKEVYAVGHFLSGEQILFTRFYQAVVLEETSGFVAEKGVEALQSGNIIVFAKRDGNTKNMVDYIYAQLQQAGRLSDKVIDATDKSLYWKMALREYKDINKRSYRDLAKELRAIGGSIQEVSVRQWLIEDSHIVGPREENTLLYIAKLTQDPYLLGDAHSYFEACEIVRKQRKSILKLIGKIIVYKLKGFVSEKDSLWGSIYENVGNLSEVLELEDIYILDKPLTVPSNFVNRPINDREVTL